MEILMHSLSIG